MKHYKRAIKFQQNNPFAWGSNLIIYEEKGDELFVGKLVFEKIDKAQILHHDAHIGLDDDAMQNLMDDMYQSGIRPTKEIDSIGAFKAQGAHLEDMRTLVFQEDKVYVTNTDLIKNFNVEVEK